MIADRVRPALAVLLALGATACASSTASPPQTAPRAAPEPEPQAVSEARLLPSDAALAAAARVELTGLEMGTMWTFENPPLDYWEERYGFRPSGEWLEHVRLASVRFGGGCSASFVSPDGLVMTNHHCARGCVDRVAGEGEDFLINGFYAGTRAEERVCPGLFLDQLVEIEEITGQIHGVAEPGMSDAEITAAQEARGEELEAACEAESGLECQVVSLFHGGQYQLYKYRRYQPVKLVFAPELQTGFFGGDPDNFTYPRYNLDVTFVRAYEADGSTPVSTPDYFAWDPEGAAEGELVFVTGNPGGTSRQITLSQYLFEAQARHPLLVDFFDSRLEVLHAIAEKDPARGRRMQNMVFGFENSQKLYRGQLAGLRDTLLTGKKIKWEREFREAVEADATLLAEYGDVWERLDAIQARKVELYPSLLIHNPNLLAPSAHLQLAAQIAQYVEQMALPEEQRARQFRENLPVIEARLRDPGELQVDQSVGMLAGRLEIGQAWLPPSDPLLAAMRMGETPWRAAERLVGASKLGDPAFRERVMTGGPEGLPAAAAEDPLLALALAMEEARELTAAAWGELAAAENVQNERFAGALFAVYGTDLPPDATFTLRITDGEVKRYRYNGTFAPAATSIHGLYARAIEFGGEMPWTLPQSWWDAKDRVNLSTYLNFVSTNDITGGNSGSPLIDRDARVVGVAFDGNVEAFPNEFLFAAENGRTVSVHSAGILEALRNVYDAAGLVEELEGGVMASSR